MPNSCAAAALNEPTSVIFFWLRIWSFETDKAFEILREELANKYAYIAINITVIINDAVKPKVYICDKINS